MTDYAKPTTPGQALLRFSCHLRDKASRLLATAEAIRTEADALGEAAREAEDEADRYDKHQPKEQTDAE